jgi:hypothetical protein
VESPACGPAYCRKLDVGPCWKSGNSDAGPDRIVAALGEEGGVGLVHFDEVLLVVGEVDRHTHDCNTQPRPSAHCSRRTNAEIVALRLTVSEVETEHAEAVGGVGEGLEGAVLDVARDEALAGTVTNAAGEEDEVPGDNQRGSDGGLCACVERRWSAAQREDGLVRGEVSRRWTDWGPWWRRQ